MATDQWAIVAAAAAVLSALTALVSAIGLLVSLRLQWRSSHAHVEVVGTTSRLMSETHVGPLNYCFDVKNTGLLPVVVTGVGVKFRRDDGGGRLGTALYARGIQGESLPRKLEPGEALSLVHPIDEMVKQQKTRGIVGVWARTAAGGTFEGKNKVKLDKLTASQD
jgi:archaellum component FlaG (FlaF/FlaG flagellin family)